MSQFDGNKELKAILKGTVKETGKKFFEALVYNLCIAINTYGAWITEYIPEERKLKALAFWLNGKFVPDYEYHIKNTPCEPVIDERRCIHVPEKVIEIFPDDPDLPEMNAVSYLGAPFVDNDGTILGHLAVLHNEPIADDPDILSVFNIFTDRAAAELKRLRAVRKVEEREEKLSRLINSAMDAFVELDSELNVTLVNPATEKVFKCSENDLVGKSFTRFLSRDGSTKLERLIEEMNRNSESKNYLWIPGGLKTVCINGEEFLSEATLSKYEMNRRTYFILILRNIEERLQAEKKIHDLTIETEYLQKEIKELFNHNEIIGRSSAILKTIKELNDVAETDTTVLILGESGTGKELIARALHNASKRKGKPLVKINCAAMPSELIESELFGHEQGAFTGATKKREGRFKLADKGTIFLDEIGELPLTLQAKLLRVLQEKEFEPVGSSFTEKADVRVIAATNRDLESEVEKGNFREDLFYRLNVFPIVVPPLRDRGDDVVLLAEKFADRFAKQLGKQIEPFTEEYKERIKSYHWPGNVRELQNVIERSVITSRRGWLNLNISLTPSSNYFKKNDYNKELIGNNDRVKKAVEIMEIEKENIIRALESANWKVSGEDGAAALLEIPPTTLSSKMKSFGIKRP